MAVPIISLLLKLCPMVERTLFTQCGKRFDFFCCYDYYYCYCYCPIVVPFQRVRNCSCGLFMCGCYLAVYRYVLFAMQILVQVSLLLLSSAFPRPDLSLCLSLCLSSLSLSFVFLSAYSLICLLTQFFLLQNRAALTTAVLPMHSFTKQCRPVLIGSVTQNCTAN